MLTLNKARLVCEGTMVIDMGEELEGESDRGADSDRVCVAPTVGAIVRVRVRMLVAVT